MVCVDVGTRGGFEPDRLPLAGAVDAIGFEPEPVAFAALASNNRHSCHRLRHLPGLLAVKMEVSFLPFRPGQPTARDVEVFLSGRVFALTDLMRPHRTRRYGYVIQPHAARQTIPYYSQGQLAQADFLFFRRPDLIPTATTACTPQRSRWLMAIRSRLGTALPGDNGRMG